MEIKHSKKELIIAAVFTIALLVTAYYFLFLKPAFQPVDKDYFISYGDLSAKKHVKLSGSEHIETLIVSSPSGKLDFSVLTVVPKSIAKSYSEINVTSSGKISVLNEDPLILFSPKASPDSIAISMKFPAKSVDVSTINVILPNEFLSSLTVSQKETLHNTLLEFAELESSAEKSNELENTISQRLIDIFYSEAEFQG